MSALLDIADLDANYRMKDLFGSGSGNEEMSLIAQQLQGSHGVQATLVGLALVNQFNPSSGGAEVHSVNYMKEGIG